MNVYIVMESHKSYIATRDYIKEVWSDESKAKNSVDKHTDENRRNYGAAYRYRGHGVLK